MIILALQKINLIHYRVSVPARIEDHIEDSYTDGTSNFFLIRAGVINNAHISTIFKKHHVAGINLFLEQETVNRTSITRAVSETVSNSVTATRLDSTSYERNRTVGAGFAAEIFGVRIGTEITVSESTQWATSDTNTVTNARHLNTNVAYIQERAERELARVNFDRDLTEGFYRLALYSRVGVWVIVETTLDNSQLLGMTMFVIPQCNGFPRWSFNRHDPIFDNSPLDSSPRIDFHYGFHRDFPIPQRLLHRTEQTFIFRPGSHTWQLPGNVRFPATIEIYALGAGGGGQGGNRHIGSVTLFGEVVYAAGTGGSGGGGAAVYTKFEVRQQTDFNINVGRGGYGGTAVRLRGNPAATPRGNPGNPGGDTVIRWGTNTITAGGGLGGRSPGLNYGGPGGRVGISPSAIPLALLNPILVNGQSGSNGGQGSNLASTGGNPGRITAGSVNPFPHDPALGAYRPRDQRIARGREATYGGGGAGEFNYDGAAARAGTRGGDGKVIITITWHE